MGLAELLEKLFCQGYDVVIYLFSHTYREGNVYADFLASLGHASTGLQWWSSLPPALPIAFLGTYVVFRIFSFFLMFVFSFLTLF
jgi:hypothetical protein